MAAVVSKSANVRVAMTFIDAFNRRDFSAWSGSLAGEFEAAYPGAASLTAEQAWQYNESFLPAFPDLHFEIQGVLEDGDQVVIEWIARGTHDGPLTSATGQTIPATHRSGLVHGVLVSRIQQGKIVRERTYWDQMELLQALGVV